MTVRRWSLAGGVIAAAAAALWAGWPAPAPPAVQARPAAPASVSVQPPAPPVLPPPPPAADLSGLKLAGVFGGAAVIEDSAGRQRLVRIGASVAPGVRLTSVGRSSAVLGDGERSIRLDLAGAPPANSAAGPARTGLSTSAARYRLAFAAEREGGRIIGFRLRPGVVPPVLAQAGLQPGDVVTKINGQRFQSTEKVIELDEEIGGAGVVAIDFIRDGTPQRVEAPIARP